MSEPAELDLEMLFSFYERVDRKAPGSTQSTLEALRRLGPFKLNPKVADFGCGCGLATLALAQAIDGTFFAIDRHIPFLQSLQTRAAQAGIGERIKPIQADMAFPPFTNGALDLIWAEGSIYNIGFSQGLRLWRPLLAAGGAVAVSEVSWLEQSLPAEILEFWQQEYPAITSVQDNLHQMAAAGFETLDHFVLPTADWGAYYGPVEEAIAQFLVENPGNIRAERLAQGIEQEISMWRKYGECFGYVFYVGRTAPPERDESDR